MSSLLETAGAAVSAVVKNVPTRGVLWAVIGLVTGSVCVGISLAIGVLVMDRGAMLLGYLLAIPFAIVALGGALFGVHGLHRGAARAALSLERDLGLVRGVVDRVMSALINLVGGPVSNLPLQQVETKLKEVVAGFSQEDGKGLAAWVIRRAQKAIIRKVETFLMTAYRAEQMTDGSGGGVSLEKVKARVTKEMSEKMGDFVMSPLNKQLFVFMTLYIALAAGWWYWLFLLARLFGIPLGQQQ